MKWFRSFPLRPNVSALVSLKRIFDEFHQMVTGELDVETDENVLGKLKIFAGVLEFPARVKCASLSWHTLHAALAGEEVVSTE